MHSRFDPSAFIEAEEKQTLAAPARVSSVAAPALETAEISHSQRVAEPALAGIATIAAGDTGTPWTDDVARFVASPRPDWVPAEHWDEITGEADLVERKWGAAVAQLGWTAIDLYGCPPAPLGRIYGQSGLVHVIVTLLTPVKLTAIDHRGAVLQPFRGPPMRYRPPPRAGTVLLWDAYRAASGP